MSAADLIESLQAQITELRKECDIADAANTALHGALAESQRRADAAVEDILVAHDRGRCEVCKHKRQDGGACKERPDRSCFEWRGLQEAEKGTTE
jgi:hypothetical protein